MLLPFLPWAMAVIRLKGRGEAAVYWILGSLLALVEPFAHRLLRGLARHLRADLTKL